MGLDMYLSAKKYLSSWSKDETEVDKIDKINKMFDIVPDEDLTAKEVSFRVAYWRKANQIHEWFVQNVQEGNDDCKEYWVGRDQLEKLVADCKEVLKDKSKAKELLPTQEGFFFGSTEYDEFYVMDLEYTVSRIENILATEAFKNMDFYYQASW